MEARVSTCVPLCLFLTNETILQTQCVLFFFFVLEGQEWGLELKEGLAPGPLTHAKG